MTGIWASQFNVIKDREDLSNSMLGFIVLCGYLGSVVVTPVSGILIRYWGSKKTVILGALLYSLSMALIAAVNGVPLLCITFFIFGFNMNIMDVAMNTSGVLVETVAERPIMGSFHGNYSIAAALGSFIGGLLTSQGYSYQEVYLLFSGLTVFLNIIGCQGLYAIKDELDIEIKSKSSEPENKEKSKLDDEEAPACMIPTGPALYLCIVGFLGASGEASLVAWCITYFDEDLNASAVNATVGFSTFYVFMGLGRFSCDKIRQYIGRQRMFFFAGILAFLGMSLVFAAPNVETSNGSIILACFGCALAGSGISTIIPTCFSTAGRLPGEHPGTAIATVAFISYSGSVVSPIMVGGLSDALSSLRWALMIEGILLLFLSPLSFGIPPETGTIDGKDSALEPLLALDEEKISIS